MSRELEANKHFRLRCVDIYGWCKWSGLTKHSHQSHASNLRLKINGHCGSIPKLRKDCTSILSLAYPRKRAVISTTSKPCIVHQFRTRAVSPPGFIFATGLFQRKDLQERRVSYIIRKDIFPKKNKIGCATEEDTPISYMQISVAVFLHTEELGYSSCIKRFNVEAMSRNWLNVLSGDPTHHWW